MNETPAASDGKEPGKDFIRPNLDVVTEEAWQEHAAQGVTVLNPSVPAASLHKVLAFCEMTWGAANVMTGDPFDEQEQRPLHHMPGRGIYVRPEGWVFYEEQQRRDAENKQRPLAT